jgi:hypothetical protein
MKTSRRWYERKAMPQSHRRIAATICLGILALILLDMLAARLRIGPPLVPLDPEGHVAAFGDSPIFGGI